MDIHRLYEIIGRSRFLQLHTRFVRSNYIILFMICQDTKKTDLPIRLQMSAERIRLF